MTKHSSQRQSVGVVGDGDDIDILEAIEETFNLTIMDEEAESIRTLEDVHAIICSKLPNDANEQTKCLTSMAYYRLNRALRETGKAKPSQRIELPPMVSARDFQKQLENRSGLRLAFLTSSSMWLSLLCWLMLGAWIVVPLMVSGSHAITLSIMLPILGVAIWRIAARFDQRRWTFDGTLADLTQHASEENIGRLISQGGKWRKADVWKIMTKIISDETGFPAEKMRPAMTLID